MPGGRVNLLSCHQPVAELQAVCAYLLDLDAAGTSAKAVLHQHHQNIPAQVDKPLRFVGLITEGVLIGPDESAHSVGSAVGRLEVEPRAGTGLDGKHRVGRVAHQP